MKITFKEDYIIDVSWDYSPMRKNTFDEIKTVKLESRELSDAESRKTQEYRKNNPEFKSFRTIQLTDEEKIVEKTFTYKKLFSKGQCFNSKFNVNILVGDNGCGKSSLIKLLIKQNPSIKFIHIDLEKSNPKITKPNPEKGITYSKEEIVTQFMWNTESHGETREGVLLSILSIKDDYDVLILDEPEQGLSLKNQKKYLNKLKDLNKNIIVITHSKVFIENVDEIFDVETMKWVNSYEYLKNI